MFQFQECYAEKNAAKSSLPDANGVIQRLLSATSPKAELKQFEVLQRQFDQAGKHLKNHCDEILAKIVTVVDTILNQQLTAWRLPKQLPGPNFKALCKQVNKLHESVSDIWREEDVKALFRKVHTKFLEAVRVEIRAGGLEDPSHPHSKALMSELVFYGQSVLLLGVLPPSELDRNCLEGLWEKGNQNNNHSARNGKAEKL